MDAFTCAGCGAEYVVIVTDAVAARTSAASCLHCAASFVAISGKFVLNIRCSDAPHWRLN